jgi:hypothetical protein
LRLCPSYHLPLKDRFCRKKLTEKSKEKMSKLNKMKRMEITFKDNCDVWYEIRKSENNLEIFNYIVDYPPSRIDIDDIYSIYPIYKSETEDGKTLIEIKGNPDEIHLKFVKKGFLKKEIGSENKTILRYLENIEIEIDKNLTLFQLRVHSPSSYISAIRRLSTTKFNNHSFEPGDLSPLNIDQSGTMQIDWSLELIEANKLKFPTEIIPFLHKLERSYDGPRQYEWLDEINEQIINKKNATISDIFFHNQVEDILSGSCFYLSAGADISPIIALQDKIRTFIFCDEYCRYPNSEYSIKEIWSKIDDKLLKQNFNKLKTINIDKKSLNIKDFHFDNGTIDKLENVSMTLWEKNKMIYCLIYLNWDNSMAFNRLYVKNKIIPKALCELLPDGGTLGAHSMIKIPYKFRMPEYSIGHKYSLGKPEEYELINDTIKYFGDYGDTYGNAGSINGINMYKRK